VATGLDPRSHIAASPLLGRLPSAAIDQLAGEAEALGLRGGETLFEAEDPADALYLVTLGRLRIELPADVPQEVAAGDVVGEIGALTGEPRMATAVAMRDTLLLRIGAPAIRRVMAANDEAERALLRHIVQRLRAPSRNRRTSRTRAVAVMPLTEDADAGGLAGRLAGALGSVLGGSVPLLTRQSVDKDLGAGAAQTRFDAREANARLVGWLHEIESDSAHLVYCADGVPEPWTLRAARQADRILLVAGTGKMLPDTLQALETAASPAARELVDCSADGRAIRLLAQSRAGFLHHCRPGDPAAMDRLARLVAGRAVGLVLGGGGARGFAHIGLLRALAEAGLPVDLVGGTSMGAFIAALHARGMEPQAIRDCCHEVFVAKNHLNDWVWPRVSLIRGRKFLKKLKQVFGDTRIEELALPFYCVSTNLTRGQPQVHRDGELATWIGTSMAVPGIAPPVVYRGELLADGAVVNSVPVEAMQALDRGPVIACDVGAPGELALPGVDGPEPEALLKARHRGKGPALSDILMRMTSMTSDLRLEENAGQADLFLRMPVADVGMFDWASLDTTIETGYRHACQVLADAAQEWPGNEPAPPFHAPRPADVPHKT
jgi:NTE family protein